MFDFTNMIATTITFSEIFYKKIPYNSLFIEKWNSIHQIWSCLFSMMSYLQACGRFINNNLVTQQAKASSKSPELLARYCDTLLKKSSKNPEEAELEDTLNLVVSFTLLLLCYSLTPSVWNYMAYTQNAIGCSEI